MVCPTRLRRKDSDISEKKSQIMSKILSYRDFINESRIAIAWTGKNETRDSILSFIGGKDRVTRMELDEFLLSLPEEKGKRADFKWIKRNKHLVKRHIDENGPNYYTLTSLAKRIMRLSRVND
jgi:hypothetical protein